LGISAALALRFADDEPLTRELLAAELDGSPATAIHDADPLEWRVFYPSAETRDAASAALVRFCRIHGIAAESMEVDDEDWARRSQAALKAIRVGNIIVAPPWDVPAPPSGASRGPQALPLLIVIEPSTGFGTGHHASTRLCLTAIQRLDLDGRRVIDVGAGSGVLAIAAAKLGASSVLAIDIDADAIQSARDNIARNSVDPSVPASTRLAGVIEARVADVATLRTAPADVLLANLTGAWLQRLAEPMSRLVRPGGALVVSGLQDSERTAVVERLEGHADVADVVSEEGWTALTFRRVR
jgi:ribosomal protein L11 methyltransferase